MATVASGAGTVNVGTVTFTVFDMNNVQVGLPATSGSEVGVMFMHQPLVMVRC